MTHKDKQPEKNFLTKDRQAQEAAPSPPKDLEMAALKRFDAFNTARGGRPAEFEYKGKALQVSVKDCDDTPEHLTGRKIDVTETHVIEGYETPVIAGFLNDLQFRPDRRLVSGMKGWVAVINYPEIHRDMQRILREQGTDDVTEAFINYGRQLSERGEQAKRSRLGYLVESAKNWAGIPDELKGDVLWTAIQTQGDYTAGGAIFQKIFEFASMASPNGTLWILSSIGHAKTRGRLAGGRKFDETGFGSLVLKAGWEWKPEVKLQTGLLEDLVSPIVSKKPDFKPTKGWIGIDKRLEELNRAYP